ncbi:hypothetical protein [Xylophilus sp. GOD-11R]|nr:hypothetical protein [Xylophilus sp. GOD-11R]WPB58984.1 hypothetical protein R9X41_10240 [Xylophilus sp. GOD-11R]
MMDRAECWVAEEFTGKHSGDSTDLCGFHREIRFPTTAATASRSV